MFDVYHQCVTKTASSFYTYFNLAIVAINAIGSLFVHFFLFGKRRNNERYFQVESAIYNKMVIENIYLLNNFFSDTHANVLSKISCSQYMKLSADDKLQEIEELCDNIENIYEEFEAKITPVFMCYSEDLLTETIRLCDDFSSCCTSALTQTIQDGYDSDMLYHHLMDAKRGYLGAAFIKVKESKPK